MLVPVVSYATEKQETLLSDHYVSLCEDKMDKVVDPVTAMRLCQCRAGKLTGRLTKKDHNDLLNGTKSEGASLKKSRYHALKIVAPCQYIVFQSGILDQCQSSPAMAIYRERNNNFCLCYAHERAVYMKEEMPAVIEKILEENPQTDQPFIELTSRQSYNETVQKHVLSCLN